MSETVQNRAVGRELLQMTALAPYLISEEFDGTAAGGSLVKFVTADPQRWLIAFYATLGGYFVWPSNKPNVAVFAGFAVPAQGLPLAFNFRDNPGMVGSEWYGLNAGAPSGMRAIAYSWRPPWQH